MIYICIITVDLHVKSLYIVYVYAASAAGGAIIFPSSLLHLEESSRKEGMTHLGNRPKKRGGTARRPLPPAISDL